VISADFALIGTTIHKVAQLIQRRIDDTIRDTGFTRLSWVAAAYLNDTPQLSIGDLAARLEVGNATAGQLVDRMVKRGWLERSPSPNDRRSQLVAPNRKARAALRKLHPRRAALEDEVLQDLSPDERQLLLVLLERIRVRLSRSE
jgi:DNA-binding MarR family transcriptional regulator